MDWLKRWQCLWQDGVGTLPAARWFTELQTHYTGSARAYHTLQHLAECLAQFDSVRSLVADPTAVEIALWGHDVIYEPQRSDNEEASAQWTQQLLQEIDAPLPLIQRVTAFIRLTKHVEEPADQDGAFLLDIDLVILGASPKRFAEYEQQVRQEYSWVAWPAFCTGRARILRAFLQRLAIYHTEYFRTHLEAQARANLTVSLTKLTQASPSES